MVPSPAPLFTPFRRLRGATILLALMVAGASDASALAETSYDNPATAEGWAWAKIKQGNAADFNERCKTTPALDARKDDDASWKSDCRQLDATFLVDILTQPVWGEKVPMAGVHIVGARIVGDIALTNARVNRELWIEKSRIESKIVLDGARTNSPISFDSSHVSGTLSASQFHDERSLSLLKTKFEQDVLLDFAKIDGFATLDDTIFESELNLESAQIGAALFMRRAAAHKTVNLKYAKVAGAVELNGSKFDAELIANSLQVGAELSMSDRTSIQNLNLYAAQIGGDVLMAGAEISGVLKVLAMQIGGNLYMGTDANTGTNARYQTVYLSASKIEGYVDLGGAIVDGDLDATALQVNHSVNANGARFHKVVLVLASIKGEFALSRAQFVGDLTAHALNVGGNLMADGASFRKVELALAKVGGTVEFSGASFADDLDAHQARINGDLLMKKGATFQSVNINNISVAGNVEVEGSRYDGVFDAAFLQVGGSFSMSKVVALKDVNWFQANIAKQLAVSETEFGGEFLAPGIKVGDYVGITSNTSFAKKAILASATIGRHLFIDHSRFATLDLSRATIATDLKLSGADSSSLWRTSDGRPGDLDLRHAHIGVLPQPGAAWPETGHLHLAGITIDRISEEMQDDKKRNSDAEFWDEWARRDRDYVPRTYQQLASVFAAAGEHGLVDEIRYLGRVREHETQFGLDWTWSAFQRWVAGFGIGTYPFRVLVWITVISLAGALYLRARSKGVLEAGHSFAWCWGASLARLVPGIEINKEFTDFFNDPKRERLTGFQMFVFSVIGALGWLLAAILVTAVSGIAGKS
jgi:hypothetical protein